MQQNKQLLKQRDIHTVVVLTLSGKWEDCIYTWQC